MLESNPFATLQQMTAGYILSRCLHVVADLGVADALDETPRTAAELAKQVGAQPGVLGRVLSLLSAHGVFEKQSEHFCHTPASRLLLSDHPQSMRQFVQVFGLPVHWQSYAALEHTLRTGNPSIEKVVSGGYWNYFAEHPQESEIFNGAMVGKSQAHIVAILASYNFSGIKRIADIGGGMGHLIEAILATRQVAQGILFDLPHVIEKVQARSSERFTLMSGDFFVDALPECDTYILMEILHDWSDPEAIAILKAVRLAARAKSKLLVIEEIIPDHPGPDWSKTLDVHMMAMLGGLQRTRQQYEDLLTKTGFACRREIDTGAGISILECVPF